MSIQKVEMTVEQKENGQYVEQVAYPFVEYDHVTMENGMDIMSMIRDDVSTPTVTHNTTSWKVGQGDSDVSESIVDSSIASMTIKGQTYQNILPNPSLRNSMTNGKTMQKLNEGYDSVNTVDGVCKSAILKGQTLVNLFNINDVKYYNNDKDHYIENDYIVLPVVNKRYNHIKIPKEKCSMFKPSTKYTLWVHMLENHTEDNGDGTTQQNGSFWLQSYDYSESIVKSSNNGFYGCRFENNETGIKSCVFETHDLETMATKTQGINFDLPCYYAKTGGIQKLAIVILEGEYSIDELPFNATFEGMQSVKMPVLTTTGKNLFDINKPFNLTYSYNNQGAEVVVDNNRITTTGLLGVVSSKSQYYNLKTGVTYTFSATPIGTDFYIRIYDNQKFSDIASGRMTKDVRNSITFTLSNTKTSDLRIVFHRAENVEGWLTEIQLEENTQATTYEPYKSNILTVNEPIELRGIGDVKDTLDCLTGQVTQRIGEMILDGSEDWSGWSGSVNELTYGAILTIDGKGEGVFANDRLIDSKILFGIDEVGIWNVTDSRIVIRVNKIEGVDSVSAVKSFLKNEPITIQYQLATPTIKTVDLSILDQDNQPVAQLNSFANGYIQVSSQGLIPTTEYEVPTSNSYYVDLMKTNTQYTMKNMQGTFTIDGIQYNASVNGTFTSPSTLSNRLMITNVVQTQPMLLEGDMTSKEVPYVEGNKSAFEGVDKVEIVSQNADNSLSNTTSFQLPHPLHSLPNGVRDEIVLDRVNHKAKIIQRVGEDLTQLDTPFITEVNLEGYPYVYKGGHIFLNTEIAPTTEMTYSINQAHQIESSNEDILRHQKEINHLYELIAQYVQVQYEAELIDIALQG